MARFRYFTCYWSVEASAQMVFSQHLRRVAAIYCRGLLICDQPGFYNDQDTHLTSELRNSLTTRLLSDIDFYGLL